jgi:hypothetical protein
MTFERPSAGLCDPQAADKLAASDLALRCYKPGADETCQHPACKAVSEHDCFGSTERSAGKQLESQALLCAEMTFASGI